MVDHRKTRGGLLYLTRDGEPVCFVCALDDASDALDGVHELRELVRAEIGEARDGTRRTDEHIWKKKS